jgi:competence protein ComEA
VDIEPTGNRTLRLRIGLGAGVVLVLLIAGIAVLVSAFTPRGTSTTAARPTASATAGDRRVSTDNPAGDQSPSAFVHVVGQVNKPGLYELAAGSRVVDAVSAAGGFTATADQTQLNLAQLVEDGQQIVVPTQGAAPAAGEPVPSTDGAAGAKVNINSADATTLQTLDGIGPALAQRIVAYRSAHGGFRTVSDLQNVTGIGPKKFAAIKSEVTT